MNLVQLFALSVQISIFLTVLSLGLRTAFDDFLFLFRRPGKLIGALISIYLVMPVFVGLMVSVLDLNPVVEVTLLILSVSPVPMLPYKFIGAGERGSFNLGLLTVTSIICVSIVPYTFKVVHVVFGRETPYSEESLVKTILINILTPLVIGIILGWLAPNLSELFAEYSEKIGSILLLVGLLPIMIELLPKILMLVGNGTIIVILLYTAAGAMAGYLLGGPDPEDRADLAMATSSRHPAIAITLAAASIGQTEIEIVAAAVVLYSLISSFAAPPYLRWFANEIHRFGRSHKETAA